MTRILGMPLLPSYSNMTRNSSYIRHLRNGPILKSGCWYWINACCAAFADAKDRAGLPDTEIQIYGANTAHHSGRVETKLFLKLYHTAPFWIYIMFGILASGASCRTFKYDFLYFGYFLGGAFHNPHHKPIFLDVWWLWNEFIVGCFILRWLITNGRTDNSIRTFPRFQSGKDHQDPLVHFEVKETGRAIEVEKEAFKVERRMLAQTPENWKETLISTCIGAFAQLNIRNYLQSYYVKQEIWLKVWKLAVVSCYLTLVLGTVGVTDTDTKTLMKGLLNILIFPVALGVALLVDRFVLYLEIEWFFHIANISITRVAMKIRVRSLWRTLFSKS